MSSDTIYSKYKNQKESGVAAYLDYLEKNTQDTLDTLESEIQNKKIIMDTNSWQEWIIRVN